MTSRPIALAFFASLLPVQSALAANCGGAVVCVCGDTVTSSYTLPADLVCAPARSIGLTIAAANVTLDGAGFDIVMSRSSSVGVVITAQPGAVVQNLTVRKSAAGVANVVGVALNDADNAVVDNNALAALGTGIRANGALSSNVVLTNNDVSLSAVDGMSLLSVDGLVLTGNDFASSKRGIRIDDLVGPWTFDPSNTFADVGRATGDYVIRLDKSVDVTLDGLDLSTSSSSVASYHHATAITINGSDGLVITNNDLSGRYQGVFTTAFGATLNTNGTITGNDVTDSDLWGMALENWDETLTFGNNDFSSSDNGLRLVEFDPAGTYAIDLADSTFTQVGQSTAQAGIKIVRSHDLVVTNFATTMIGRGTGLKIEDSDHVDVDNVRVCGTTRVGIDLGINTLGGPPGAGADDNVVGSPGNAFVEDSDVAGVRVSVESTNNVLDVVAQGAGASLVDNAPVGQTTGTVSRIGVPGFGFQDLDGDTCNDLCGDSEDADGDTFCDAGDFQPASGTLLDNTDVAWTTGGIGSPSVVFDEDAGAWLMVYETQTAPSDSVCMNGYWSLGLATSADGVTWTDAGGPLLSPSPGTYYSCVAAHPTVVQNGSTTVIFFKAETDAVGGFAQYSGIGRMLVSWNGGSYDVTAPDPTVLLSESQSFGYPRAVFDATAGIYRFVVSRFPSLWVTSGPATGPLAALTEVLVPGDVGWGPDELFNPAVACGVEGDGWTLFLGGRALSGTITAPIIDDQGLGRLTSADFTTWAEGSVGAVVSTTSGDVELRHWDVVPLGSVDYALFYDDKGGPGGTNQIRVANTSASSWNATLAATHGTKVCTP
jgi:hypothetical protein